MDDVLSDEALLAAPETPGEAPLALYRRYRPDVFAEMIGQEHVTGPLQRALTNNRVNHAYLFSGPRGCGKTTSARILARALNCAQGPTATPCGVCDSCVALARGGPGSIDVLEIDAASHGGVDDARDLRERAFFSPVSSRYKIYIVDEAHMVSPAGFNALLKLVEEPPPHVKFIFATTEPEKVIGTIRSRTHHYPFRLVPPRVLGDYLAHLCQAEGVGVEQGVLPLVVRAGAGSVRDSLSVLDQLLGGADEGQVSYGHAAALLGYTPDSLLDEIVDAFAAGDAAGVFAAVDKVIEVGQDPRRFAEDLLRRLRDLVVVAAVPNAVSAGLVDVSADQAERLQSQAGSLGAGELTRAAEVIADGLTEMRGTTAPRLHLELMCSRVLLPGADVDDRGVHARLDRLERRIGMMGPAEDQPSPAPQRRSRPAEVDPAAPVTPSSEPVRQAGTDQQSVREPRVEPVPPRDPGHGMSTPGPEDAGDMPGHPDDIESGRQEPSPPVTGVSPTGSDSTRSGPTVTEVRRLWPQVLEELRSRRRFTWILITQNAHVVDVSSGTLVLGFKNAGGRDNFAKGGSEDVLIDSLIQVMGAQLRIEAIVDPSAGDSGRGVGRPAAAPHTATDDAASPSTDTRHGDSGAPQQASAGPLARSDAAGSPGAEPYDPDHDPPDPDLASAPPQARHEAGGSPRESAPGAVRDTATIRENIRPTRVQGHAREPEPSADEIIDRTDDTVADSAESHAELLARQLGAEIIDEDPGTA